MTCRAHFNKLQSQQWLLLPASICHELSQAYMRLRLQ